MSLLYWGIGGVTLLIVILGFRIVRPTHRMLVETFGKYSRTAQSGLQWIIPLVQRSVYVNTTEQMVDIQPQTVITKDNLNAMVDAVVYYQIKDVKNSQYNVDHHETQLVSLARTTLRAVIGKLTFTQANEERDKINGQVETILDKETNSYGVEVLRVEIQKIQAPRDVQEAMNDVVMAERKKIAAKDFANAEEIKADGIKRASIKQAQGIRESMILKAQANKQSTVLNAEGDKQGTILKAEGEAKGFDLVNKSFKDNAQVLKQMEVTQASLQDNSKVVITQKGINPSLIMDAIPIKNETKREEPFDTHERSYKGGRR